MTILSSTCWHSTRRLINLEIMAPKKRDRQIAIAAEIERAIHVFRGQRVMLDSDLAALYGVTTRA